MRNRLCRYAIPSLLILALSLSLIFPFTHLAARVSGLGSEAGAAKQNSFEKKMKLPFGFGFSRRGPRAEQAQPDPKAAGLPNVLNAKSALSAAVLVASGISGSPNSE